MSVYTEIRDASVQAVIDVRTGKAERDLIERMMRRHEIVRRHGGDKLEPIQLTFGDRP